MGKERERESNRERWRERAIERERERERALLFVSSSSTIDEGTFCFSFLRLLCLNYSQTK